MNLRSLVRIDRLAMRSGLVALSDLPFQMELQEKS